MLLKANLWCVSSLEIIGEQLAKGENKNFKKFSTDKHDCKESKILKFSLLTLLTINSCQCCSTYSADIF